MAKMLRLLSVVFAALVAAAVFAAPVFADDMSGSGKAVSLKINWLDDAPADRPKSLTVEFYRVVDGEEIAMDAKTLTKQDAVSASTWQAYFEYQSGPVWEYAFKLLGADPEEALYAYKLTESGAGTDAYTFDFRYGQGDTTMTIKTVFKGDSAKTRPQKLTADIFSLSGDGTPERTVTLSGKKDVWYAEVTGLENDPAEYYVVVRGLPEGYENVMTRGDDETVYVSTNTYTAPAQESGSDMMASALAGSASVLKQQTARRSLMLLCGAALLTGAGVLAQAVIKRRRRARRKKDRR